MDYAEVLARYGTQTAIAEALGITQSTVSAWKGTVPAYYQYQLEIISQGKLRVDDDLRVPGTSHGRIPHARAGA